MKRSLINRLILTSTFLLIALTAQGEEPNPIDVQLTVLKVENSPAGLETLNQARTIHPGDILQYELLYRIKGTGKVLELLAQLPVPEGMEYMADTAQPTNVLVSRDGEDFLPLPLSRKGGNSGVAELPPETPLVEYRYLGWPLRGISPGEEAKVSARLKVNFVTTSTLVQ